MRFLTYSPAPRQFGALFMDVTERKQAEEKEGKELKETSFTNRILALFVVHDGDELFNRVLAVVQERWPANMGSLAISPNRATFSAPACQKCSTNAKLKVNAFTTRPRNGRACGLAR